jgi:hypothetical protein
MPIFRNRHSGRRAVTVAIAIPRALDGLLVPSGTNQTVHVGLHQKLHNSLGHIAQEVFTPSLLQQLRQWQSVVGHRVLFGSG